MNHYWRGDIASARDGSFFLIAILMCSSANLKTAYGAGPDTNVDRDEKILYGLNSMQQVGFLVWSADGRYRPLTFSPVGATNTTLLRIGAREVVFGDPKEDKGRWDPKSALLEPDPKGTPRIGRISVWVFGELRITQTVEILNPDEGPRNTCRLSYVLKNHGKIPLKVGVRHLLDTCIGANDANSFAIPGGDLIAKYHDFKDAEAIPRYIKALEVADLKDPGFFGFLTLKLGRGFENPDRFIVTRRPDRLADWDVKVEDMRDDSAVVIYWNPQEIQPNNVRRMGYEYGRGQPLLSK